MKGCREAALLHFMQTHGVRGMELVPASNTNSNIRSIRSSSVHRKGAWRLGSLRVLGVFAVPAGKVVRPYACLSRLTYSAIITTIKIGLAQNADQPM